MSLKRIKKLSDVEKEYLSTEDLKKILGQEKPTLYVSLNRMVKEGVLKRLRRGIYQLESKFLNLERVAQETYFPSYLSFESALALYGVISQQPYTLTFATTKKTKKITIDNREVNYRKIKKELFWGYYLKDGIYLAEKEKAFLDLLYLVTRGKSKADLDEIDFKKLSPQKINLYLKEFPSEVGRVIKK